MQLRGSEPPTTFDHLLAQDRLGRGAPFALEVAGGRKDKTPFWLDLVDEEGTLRLDGSAPRGLRPGRIGLLENGDRVAIDKGGLALLPDPAVNIAGTYAGLQDDVLASAWRIAGFDHAARLARMIEDAFVSSDQGRTVEQGEWPEG